MNFFSYIKGMSNPKLVGLFLGLFLFFFILTFVDLDPANPILTRTAAVAVLMAVWWITEAIPIPATSLLPLALFPLFHIQSGKSVAPLYMNSSMILFTGGFIIALAIEKWNLHKRIALHILLLAGNNPKRLILSFMIATAFLSMWISNTATTMMMLAIGMSIISTFEDLIRKANPNNEENEEMEKQIKRFSLDFMLGIAYSANVGGIATLVGTPPNIILQRIYQSEFPLYPELSFGKWFMVGLPLTCVFLLIIWYLLTYVIYPIRLKQISGSSDIIQKELEGMGRPTAAEKSCLVVFIITAILWIFRSDLTFGEFVIPGWASLFSFGDYVDDGTVAITMGLLLFLLPSGNPSSPRLMDWDTAKKVPWGILLLFGGGFALAGGLETSGLSLWIGGQLPFAKDMPWQLLTLLISMMVTFLTEVSSNTAITQMILPVLAGVAETININPLLLMIPATISASCAFMLPVATPPNAIVYASNRVPIAKMAIAGFFLNIIGIFLVLLTTWFIAIPVFEIAR